MILEANPKDALRGFLHLCVPFGIDVQMIERVALASIKYYRGDAEAREALHDTRELENRWYKSLEDGKPDFSVYDADAYLADLWACWVMYSRRYMVTMRAPTSMTDHSVMDDIKPVSSLVDLGCGIGYTTAAWRELFPNAEVIGTNFADIVQTKIAQFLGHRFGFEVVPDFRAISAPVDVVFASEYFEHIPKPIEHLRSIINILRPRVILAANTFGTRSIGHFDYYVDDAERHDGRRTAKLFSDTLRHYSYTKVETRLWNNRPAYWKR